MNVADDVEPAYDGDLLTLGRIDAANSADGSLGPGKDAASISQLLQARTG
jgi:hypothetical protein